MCPSTARWSRGHAGGRAAHRVGCTCPGTQPQHWTALQAEPAVLPCSRQAREEELPVPMFTAPEESTPNGSFLTGSEAATGASAGATAG